MTDDFTIKLLKTMDDLKAVQKLEKHVWGMEPIPVHQTFTAAKNGGILLGAFAGNLMVGFNYGFPGFHRGSVYLCSHMTGIDPDFQNQGLGQIIKEKQKEIALDFGYKMIQWTYDPLESINANLNLRKLRGITAMYSENHYGAMNDSLNIGIPTDRFTIQWWIDSDHVKDQQYWFHEVEPDQDNVLLNVEQNHNGIPLANDISENIQHKIADHDALFVPIPSSFQTIKKSEVNIAVDWRLKTRKVFQNLLSKGFVGADLRRGNDNNTHYYVFVKKDRLLLGERSGCHG